LLALTGCKRDQRQGSGTESAPKATAPGPETAAGGSGAAPAAAAPAAGGTEVSGTVVETMNSGGYTYAKLDDGGKQVWVAGPETGLAVGVKVGKTTGTPMPGFTSTTLKRTFDEIYFVNEFTVTGSAGPNPHAAGAPPPATVVTEKIAPAPGGKTVAQVFEGKDALAGKPIAIRGKIVKVNNGILNRNWIHLQDGTGASGMNDLMVTTDATVKQGDVVLVRGTVAVNKDFGGGYKYAVIVEDAKIETK
jgi:hypothetical protein